MPDNFQQLSKPVVTTHNLTLLWGQPLEVEKQVGQEVEEIASIF
jgi:hypothetical protein